MIHQYSRAKRLLTRPFPVATPSRRVATDHPAHDSSTAVNISFDPKGKGKEIEMHTNSMVRLPMGPAGFIKLPEKVQTNVSRLVDMSVACRYLAAQC